MRRARPTARWRTAAGEVLLVRKMSNQHLANAARMLERRAASELAAAQYAAYSAAATLSGEMATYFAEQECDALAMMTPEDVLAEAVPVYADLVDELEWRIAGGSSSDG